MISTNTENQISSSQSIYLLSILGLIVLTIVLYWPSLFYDFMRSADDDWLIINNPAIKDLSFKGLKYIFFEDKLEMHYHPLTYVSLAIDYHFFGLSAKAMKVHNLILHLGCGILVLVFFAELSINKWIALLAFGLFLVHPLQLESVVWVICRRQVLFVFYSLLALICYSKSLKVEKKSMLFFGLAILFYCLAMLSKVSAFTLPFVFVLLAWYKGKLLINNKTVWLKLLLFIPIMYFFVELNTEANSRNFLAREFSYEWWHHFFFTGYSYGWYWLKAIFPYPQSIFYPVMAENSKMPIIYFVYTIFSLGILLGGVYAYKKGYKLGVFIILFYSITICIKLNRILLPPADIPTLVADRYIYFSSPAIFLAISWLLFLVIKNRIVFFVLGVTLVIGYSVVTRIHLPAWKDDYALVSDVIKHYPNEDFYERLALIQMREGNMLSAYKSLKKMEDLNSNIWIKNHWFTDFQLGQIYFNQSDYEKSQLHMEKSLENGALNIDYANYYLGLSKLFQSDSTGYINLNIALENLINEYNLKEFREILVWKEDDFRENYKYEIPLNFSLNN